MSLEEQIMSKGKYPSIFSRQLGGYRLFIFSFLYTMLYKYGKPVGLVGYTCISEIIKI